MLITKRSGFTLIEMSIVLVVIGLIVGGVLVGQDLVRAAYVRAQISQIEKYNTAVNTFYGKYQALPGDVGQTTAQQYGLAPRGAYPGQGDGNGILEGVAGNAPSQNSGLFTFSGETGMFWVDLSQAHLIEGGFNTASILTSPASVSGTQLSKYLPEAKIGQGSYVYVWSGGWRLAYQNVSDGQNYFTIASITESFDGKRPAAIPSLTVRQAFLIDSKVDDGLPQSGRVMAIYDSFTWYWAAGGQAHFAFGELNTGDFDPSTNGPVTAGDGVVTAGTANTCYDNRSAGGIEQYSMDQNKGAGLNCALSFQFR